MKNILRKSTVIFLVLVLCLGTSGFADDSNGLGRILIDSDFEDPGVLNRLKLVTGENAITLETDRKRDSNYIQIARTKEGDAYVQTSIASPPDNMVFEADIKFDALSSSVQPFTFRSPDTSGNVSNISISSTGQINSHQGVNLGQIELYTWYNIAMAINFVTGTFDFYLDGKMTGENIGMKPLNEEPISSCRMYATKGGGETLWGIDNLRIYEALMPVSKEEMEKVAQSLDRKSAYPADDPVIVALSGMVALNYKSGLMFYGGEKVVPDVKSYVKNGVTYVPVRAISEGFNKQVEWDAVNRNVTIDGNIVLTIDSNVAKTPSGNVTLAAAPEIADGRTFLPLRAMAEQVLNKRLYWDGDCLVVISDAKFAGEDNKELSDLTKEFLTYQRPSRNRLKEDFERQGSNGVHPRLMIRPEDVARMKQLIADGDEIMNLGLKRLVNTAEGYVNAPPVDYALSSSSQLLSKSRLLLQKAEFLGPAYLITDDPRYAEALYKNLESVANFPDWNHHTHYLDVGEMAAGYAMGFDYIYNYLTPERREFLSEALKKHCINPARTSHYSNGLTYSNNWNSVVNGGIAMAALMLADEPGYEDIAFDTVEKCIRALEYMMPEFIPDGAWEESSGYWNLAMRYCMRMFASLESACGTSYGLTEAEGFRTSGFFAAQVNGPTGLYNYHDSSYQTPDWNMFMWLAKTLDMPEYALLRFYNLEMFNKQVSPYDMMFYNPEYTKEGGSEILDLDAYFRRVELISLRSSWADRSGLYVGAHGGYGKVPHWNLDSGTFVIDAMGERFASDLGSDSYSLPGYINTQSHLYYKKRTEGQNCVVINPDESMGQVYEAFSPVTDFVSKPRGSYAIFDLSDAYAENAKSYKRGFMLGDNRNTITIRDEINLLKNPSELYWFMHTEANAEVQEGNKVLLTKGGKQLLMEYAVEGADSYEFLVMDPKPLPTSPNPDGQSKNDAYKRLAIRVSGSGEIDITVKFTLLAMREYMPEFVPVKLDQWHIEDGEKIKAPLLSRILVNGEAIRNFKPEGNVYEVVLQPDETSIPTVTAEGDNVDIEIIQAQGVNETAEIKVYSKEDKRVVNIYLITFKQLPKLEDVDGRTRYSVYHVEASDVPQEENGPFNVTDSSLNTRWSAEGYGVWIELDIGEPQDVAAIGVAYYSGASRTASFILEVSADGQVYETVFDGKSELTNDIVIYPLKETQKVRFVRLTGNGTSAGMWNSITEIAVLGQKK